jgi:PAS domain S-box-containing protein
MATSLQFLLSLAQNISLFLMFVVGYAVLHRRMAGKNAGVTSLIEGVIFGFAAVLAMSAPLRIADGVILDSRNVIVAAGTVAGGPVAGLMTALIAAAYRMHIGGSGLYPALTSISLVFVGGAIFRWKLQEAALEPKYLALLGVIISIGVLPTYFLLPSEQIWPVLRSVLLPVVIATPVGLFMLGSMLRFERRWSDLQAELRERSQLLSAIINSMSDGVSVANAKGEIVFVNPASERLTGVPAMTVPNEHWASEFGVFEVDGSTPFEGDNMPLIRALRGELSDNIELMVRNAANPDGRLISVNGRPLLGPDGTPNGGVVVFRDMTRYKEMEAALREASERFELAASSTEDGIYDYNIATGLSWTSKRFRSIRGRQGEAEVLPADYWMKTVVPQDLPRLLDSMHALVQKKIERMDITFRVLRPDGVTVYIQSRAILVCNPDGTPARIVGSNADVTARIQAEVRLRSAIENMESGFALFDADDRLVLCNDGFVDEGTRRTFGDPTGRTFAEIMTAFAHNEFTAVEALPDREAWLAWRLEQHCHPPEQPLEIEWTDGRWMRVTERRTTEGGYVGLWADITDQKRRQVELEYSKDQLARQASELVELAESLELAKQDAEQANLAKSRFLASMSHELRTPLNSILGFSDIMKLGIHGPIMPERYSEYVHLIHNSGAHLLSLINDVLDLSKIEAGKMHLVLEPLSALEVTHQAVGLTEQLAQNQGVTVTSEIGDGCDVVHGDARAVKQMLLNLLSNAIKFTDTGGAVRLRLARSDAGVALQVTDTGIGMTPAELAKALEPYGQTDAARSRGTVGTGLGLPLVKALAEMHGGSLVLESVKGAGTTATVSLPWIAAIQAA